MDQVCKEIIEVQYIPFSDASTSLSWPVISLTATKPFRIVDWTDIVLSHRNLNKFLNFSFIWRADDMTSLVLRDMSWCNTDQFWTGVVFPGCPHFSCLVLTSQSSLLTSHFTSPNQPITWNINFADAEIFFLSLLSQTTDTRHRSAPSSFHMNDNFKYDIV